MGRGKEEGTKKIRQIPNRRSSRRGITGEYNYCIIKDLLGDGIFAVNGDKWLHQRKLASHEFSTKVLRSFSSVAFRKNAAKLAKKISAAAAGSTVIDLQDLLMKSMLDSIFKVGFGLEIDTLSGSDEFGVCFSKAFDESNWIVFRRYVDIFWSAKRYLNIGLERQLKKNIKIIDDFVYQLIQRKRENMQNEQDVRNKEDILSRFILASNEDPDERITDKYLRDIILNFLIAGKDTSANTLSWFFYMLCKHPTIQERIALEIIESVGDKVVSNEKGNYSSVDEFTARLTEQSMDKMQYLHAAITETLRLYPAVPVDGKCADEDDVLPDGLKVKKGDGVNYMMYAMGRMTYLWGEDADEFKPDRWLANGVFQPASPFKFVAFNAGPRICLGKEFAYRQMKILAATLIHFFRFRLEDESRSIKYRTMFTLHIDGGLPVTALRRIKCE
ncbi:cytochrome P450 704C1-like [Ananas comosus]|uniref:Cytochrome P450 704C1-like n=1 Tax=Ananas comosus TaxID=4615 RepID=A0A6P5GX89_ANACO|nr:cytochrome P450 704C1-like [Ananas comosus]